MSITPIQVLHDKQEERISSVPLRYMGNDGTYTCYGSCESIGLKFPHSDPSHKMAMRPYDRGYLINVGTTVKNLISIQQVDGMTLAAFYQQIATTTELGKLITIDWNANRGICWYGQIGESYYDPGVTLNLWSWLYTTPVIDNLAASWIYISAIPTIGWPQEVNPEYPTPNIAITEPTWVSIEYQNLLVVGREKNPIKIYKRPLIYPYYSGDNNTFISSYINKDLPCLLDPGYYAFSTQSTTWSESPADTFTCPDSLPFEVIFERPKKYFDISNNIYSFSRPLDTVLEAPYSLLHGESRISVEPLLDSSSHLHGPVTVDNNAVLAHYINCYPTMGGSVMPPGYYIFIHRPTITFWILAIIF